MRRALALASLVALTGCEEKAVYLHDTMYVFHWFTWPVLVVVGAIHLAAVCGFVLLIVQIVRGRRPDRPPE